MSKIHLESQSGEHIICLESLARRDLEAISLACLSDESELWPVCTKSHESVDGFSSQFGDRQEQRRYEARYLARS